MELISIIKDFHPRNDEKLLEKATRLKPVLRHSIVEPVGGFQLRSRYSPERDEIVLQKLETLSMGKGQNLCLDFGTHRVGYLTLDLSFTGSHPDAPAYLKLKFAETLGELSENSGDYSGWVSGSWIQEEYVHVDLLPAVISLPRRYAFRYLKITMLDTSPKYKLVVKHAECRTETSADLRKVPSILAQIPAKDGLLERMKEVSLRTLADCMQEVFEDGPKRDRRLWTGDLRLQALVNYASFRDFDLVKRCLYLFAGSRFPDGRVSACVFDKPEPAGDDTWMFDYSLFFVCALEEYLAETEKDGKSDEEALSDLYETAMDQINYALGMTDERGTVTKEAAAAAFIDWADELDRTACAHAILLYAVRFALRLAYRKQDQERILQLTKAQEELHEAARRIFWDPDRRCFVSGAQTSIASQIWMILAGAASREEAREIMERSDTFMREVPMKTPYMHHYYMEALLAAGLKEKALAHMREYWGGMIMYGADTFWEAWDPEDPTSSPYGGSIVNSYCHAWSCTPLYFMKKYF